MTQFTDDRFLGGKVLVRQPVAGFRSGLDAVMLAAAVPVEEGEACLELGSGAGAASLCLAQRIGACRITGLEIDAGLVGLAKDNAQANALQSHVQFVQADLFELPPDLKKGFAHVFSNPPFHASAGGDPPASRSRETALHDSGRFRAWIEAGAKRTASGGTFTLILRADRLGEALSVLPDRGLAIYPLWPRFGVAAKRVIVQLRRSSGSPSTMLPGLVLHDDDGHYTPAADAILRGGGSLALAGP